MELYHATPIENLDSILAEGIKPFPNQTSKGEPEVCLSPSMFGAAIYAIEVDRWKVSTGQKEKLAEGYVVLSVDATNYNPQIGYYDEFVVKEDIDPKDIRPVMKGKLESWIKVLRLDET
jgi:hypothetical protein